MIHKYSNMRVLEIFFKRPTTLHFVREIGRLIKLAPPSVKLMIKDLLSSELIEIKKSKPFDGFIANRNEKFIFYKRAYNLFSLYELKQEIISEISPLTIILFGSYSRGEDTEASDIDLVVVSKVKKEIKLEKYEQILERKINIMIINNLDEMEKSIRKKLNNGIVLHGEI